MLRGLIVAACLVPACTRVPAEPPARSPAGNPDLALHALAEAPVASAPQRPRRVGRLSPPFSLGAPARNVLARASANGTERDVASR
jgi:hypothetical protein